MNKADNLLAAFRQVGVGKVASRNGNHHADVAKDGNANADQFRDQLRMIERGTKTAAKTATDLKVLPDQGVDAAIHEAEPADEISSRTKDRSARSNEATSHRSAADPTASILDWRGPDAALSAVLSRLDQAQVPTERGGDAATRATRAARPVAGGAHDDMSPDVDLSIESVTSDSNAAPRFALPAAASDTQIAPAVKVAVRGQETHFEPVQPVSVLQKIVDQLATDLSTAAPQPTTGSADAQQPDIQRGADKPLRMLTLELDPPNLGAVTVKMRMAGDAVEIRLTADRVETMRMLQKERGALSEAMQSAGYTFDIAAIDHTRAGDAGLNPSQQQAQPDHKSSQQSFAGSQFENGGSGQQSGEAQSGARQQRQGHDRLAEPAVRPQAKDGVRDRAGGAVYL